MKNLAPIALFVYNRLEQTQKTIEALKRNPLAKNSILYVFSDGQKSKEDLGVFKVREYIRKINGFKKVIVKERLGNIGLANSLISGISEVLEKNEKIIVLEDDIFTSKYFLEYMNSALEIYKEDKEVFGVAGYMYPIKNKLPETFFIDFSNCWGWGTWRRAWNHFEEDGRKLLNEIKKRKLKRKFDFNNSYPYFKMLKGQTKGKNNSWAIRWAASVFLNNGLFLYPKKSLVRNIGFDEGGTHCKGNNLFETELYNHPIKVQRIEKREDTFARKEIENFFKSIKLKRIKGKIWRELNKIFKNGKR